MNLENQLISGYDDRQFIVQQPWPKVDFPPKSLTFRTWEELGKKFHISFFSFAPTTVADDSAIIKESLGFAVDLAKNPAKYRLREPYHIGLEAYDAWVGAVKAGHGSSHGNWWNGTVWWECRKMASKFFLEVAKFQGNISKKALDLSKRYRDVAVVLDKARDKRLKDNVRIESIQEAQKTEESCIRRIEELLLVFSVAS